MDFGVVFQCDPPAREVVSLAQRAERAGFSHVWTFDSHVLWQEPFVIYSQILATTERVIVGPMVTNPSTRDWTVTASLFATLNEMYGNRTVCGIGRGDSAGAGARRPADDASRTAGVRRRDPDLGNGRQVHFRDRDLQFLWAPQSRLEVWVAAYGPKALALTGEVGDGYILQLADPDIAAWMIKAVREAAEKVGRDPAGIKVLRGGAGLRRRRSRPPARADPWFGGMVGNHVADIVSRYGTSGGAVPAVLTDYIAGRKGYDYAEHGPGRQHAHRLRADEVVDRFCILGPVEEASRTGSRSCRALGVDQFAVYLQHDAKESTLDAYGRRDSGARSRQYRMKQTARLRGPRVVAGSRCGRVQGGRRPGRHEALRRPDPPPRRRRAMPHVSTSCAG
jgi:probable F420-dependent oxidoreductase